MEAVRSILQLSFLEFLWIGSLAGFWLGVALLFKPDRAAHWNRYCSRWVGSDKLREVLDRPRWIERFMYRHHRSVGAGVFGGALIVLYTFFFHYNLRTVSAVVPRGYWWLSDALMSVLLIGSVVAALVGSVVLIRPSLLRDIERAANRWISTERLPAVLNGMHGAAEQVMLRHHWLSGAILLLGSLYVLVMLGYFLFHGGGRL